MTLLKRIVLPLSTLVVASFLIFSTLYIVPGSPVAFILGGNEGQGTPEQIALVEKTYHFDEPLLVQYGLWAQQVLRGDLGTSFILRDDVSHLIAVRAPTTSLLLVMALGLSVSFGLAIGIVASLLDRRSNWIVSAITTVAFATPGFVAALVLVSVFALKLNWFPAVGAGTGVMNRIWHLALPAVALAVSNAAVISRITKVSMQAEFQRGHVETAVARGIAWPTVIVRHVFRNALIPVVTVGGLNVMSLIVGAVVIEQSFALDGLGSLLLSSVQHKDFPVVQAIELLLITLFILVNMGVDLLYLVVDPRIRHRVAGR